LRVESGGLIGALPLGNCAQYYQGPVGINWRKVLAFGMRKTRASSLIVIALGLVFVSGCGGSAGSTGLQSPTGPTATTVVGDASIQYTGHAVPFTGQGGNSDLSVVGLSGASFGTVSFSPRPNLAACPLVYTSANIPSQIILDPGIPVQLTNSLVPASSPCFAPDGRILYTLQTETTPWPLYTVNRDGSGAKLLIASSVLHENAYWSPTNNVIAFDDGANIWTVRPDGTKQTKLTSGTSPVVTPDGTKIIYEKTLSGLAHIYSISVNGGTPIDLTPNDTSSAHQPSVSPDGTRIAYTQVTSNGQFIAVADLNTGDLVLNNMSTSNACFAPTFAADGKSIMFSQGFPPVFYSQPVTGGNLTAIYTGSATPASGTGAIMASFLPKQTFIGVGGSMFTTPAAGILWTQSLDQFDSFLAFSTTTPSTAKITQMSTGGGDLVFSLHGDALQALKFVTGYTIPPVAFTVAGATDILVSVNPNTGQFMTFAPYVARGNVARTAARSTSRTFPGPFTAVYDVHGNNLAPGGAAQLTLDAKSGVLR
jgi:WD40 repeat protein